VSNSVSLQDKVHINTQTDVPVVGSSSTTRRRLVVRLALKMAEIDCEFIFGNAGVSGPGRWCHLESLTLEVKMKMDVEDPWAVATNSSRF
jgi:hypothetical protein